ncbi:reverse transcriptase domain-containing protein [Tanacetum coccineum]
MRTRLSGPVVEPSTTPRRRHNKKHSQQVDPTIVEKPVVTMADTRTMAELLQAPTEGYGDAIVIPAILAENFELKHGLLNLVTSKQFCGFEKEDPHAHIRWFNKITSTIKYKDVPNSSIKLMLFPFSIEGAARIWLEKEPPRSIVTWEDLVSKFINQFFPPSKTTNLRNEITNFQQRFDESFCEAWERFKDLLRACPHHGFTELHQIDTFYNSLTSTDQDSLNAAAGGNLLTKTPKDALTLIENNKDNDSSDENLVQNPSESEATSDNESECDLPIFDNSHLDVSEDNCVIFSRPLFDSYGDSTSSEYSNDNESFSEETDSLMEEIDIFLAVDDSIPPGIDSDGYDSEEDNLFLEYEPDPGDLTRVVMEDIFGEPRVHMPKFNHILPLSGSGLHSFY